MPNKKEVAFELFEQGKGPGDEEIKALGLKGKVPFTYYRKWKTIKEEAGELVPESETGISKLGVASTSGVAKVIPPPGGVGITCSENLLPSSLRGSPHVLCGVLNCRCTKHHIV